MKKFYSRVFSSRRDAKGSQSNGVSPTTSREVLIVVAFKSTQIARLAHSSDDDGCWPMMVTLYRQSKELVAVGAADGEDAARQAAILVLKMEGGLRVGDVIQITRI
jgi:hypothetical protein